MVLLSGCGRQVTGLNVATTGTVPTGQTLIRFETAGPLDFQNLSYLIVFNTTGSGNQPYAQGYTNTDYKGWSAYFLVGGGANFANAPGLVQIYQDPASGSAQPFTVNIPTGTMSFQTSIPTTNSQYGFQITFNRCILDLPPPTSGLPPVTSNRICPPYTYIAGTWNVSLFTLDRTKSPVDSLGTTGPSDTSYKFSFDTSQTISTTYFKPASNSTTQNLSAQIVGVEVFSTP